MPCDVEGWTLSLSAFRIKSGRQAGGGCGATRKQHQHLQHMLPLLPARLKSTTHFKNHQHLPTSQNKLSSPGLAQRLRKKICMYLKNDQSASKPPSAGWHTLLYVQLQWGDRLDSCCILLPSVSCCFVPLHSGQVEQETTLGDVVWISCAVSVSGMELWRTVNYILYQSNPKQLCRLM